MTDAEELKRFATRDIATQEALERMVDHVAIGHGRTRQDFGFRCARAGFNAGIDYALRTPQPQTMRTRRMIPLKTVIDLDDGAIRIEANGEQCSWTWGDGVDGIEIFNPSVIFRATPNWAMLTSSHLGTASPLTTGRVYRLRFDSIFDSVDTFAKLVEVQDVNMVKVNHGMLRFELQR